MTGDGRDSDAHARRSAGVGLPYPRSGRSGAGRLVALGCRRHPAERVAAAAADRLAGVDVVFAAPESEATVLFYAEAWRVESLDGAAHVASWFAAHPGGTAAIVSSADAGPLLADLHLLLPGLQIDRASGLVLGPPRRRRLGETAR